MSVDLVLHRRRLAARVSGWSFVTVGAGHLATMAAQLPAPRDPLRDRAFDALALVPGSMPGPSRTLADLVPGFSAAMAVTAISTGAMVLAAARSGERAPEGLRAALRIAAVAATATLGI